MNRNEFVSCFSIENSCRRKWSQRLFDHNFDDTNCENKSIRNQMVTSTIYHLIFILLWLFLIYVIWLKIKVTIQFNSYNYSIRNIYLCSQWFCGNSVIFGITHIVIKNNFAMQFVFFVWWQLCSKVFRYYSK